MQEQHVLNNRYQLEERLGTGGMALVFRATDLMLERVVAIKLLRQNFALDNEFRERFRQEAKAAANLSHPNLVTVHDFGWDGDFPYLVMEHVPGYHLKQLVQRNGALPVNTAINLIAQACSGVGYAHRAGLIHCDLKPHNLLVTPDWRVKVTDFGIARALASIQPDEKNPVVWGSPQYFAPEQAAGSPPSPASDVYSLGVVLYELLTGRLPFLANTPSELARLHQTATPMRPAQINPNIPAALDEIVLKVLSKEPSNRYRTADQFGRILLSITAPDTSQSQAQTVYSSANIPSKPLKPPAPPVNPPIRSSATPSQPVRVSAYTQPPVTPASQPAEEQDSLANPFDLDWASVILGLLAIVAVGGLIPFWIWIYFTFNPLSP